MPLQSFEKVNELCEEKKVPFWRAIQLEDMEERSVSEKESFFKLQEIWKAMLSASESYDPGLRSNSGLVGGMGEKMNQYRLRAVTLCGDFISRVVVQALQMGESNACMKKIVAAPTAGSCGVLPAVLIPLYQDKAVSSEKIIKGLYVAAGIGQIISSRAFISGAQGGCQAEIGAASAMAAGALVYLRSGNNIQIIQSVALAMKNLLGLVCDPVAGLVEVPCVKRNVIGAINALAAADMALAGIESKIPTDQVIDAMKEVGESMHISFKETGEGGLANTLRGREIMQML